MNVNDLTLGQIREIQADIGGGASTGSGPYKIGEAMLIRTVTNYWTGRIVSIYPGELVLEEAAWIADTGRFSEALQNGIETLSDSEIEPVPGPVVVSRAAIIDAVLYSKKLPKEKK